MQKKWYTILDQKGTDHSEGNENGASIKFETKNIKSSLCDYLHQYILATDDLTVTFGNTDTDIGLKDCALFTKCINHINNQDIDTAGEIDIAMPIYNLIDYCDNYPDTFGW